MSSAAPSPSAAAAARAVVTIGSRKSDLALWQANCVAAQLRAAFPATTFAIRTETTSGDQQLGQPLAVLAAAVPGLFTKELEAGLVSGAYDLVVHSLKDMPTTLPAGLVLAAVSEREDPRDALILSARADAAAVAAAAAAGLASLPAGAVVGTSSVRREALLRRQFPALRVCSVRGNLATRLRKLDAPPLPAAAGAAAASGSGSGGSGSGSGSGSCCAPSDDAAAAPAVTYDALLLAHAGIKRLGWEARVSSTLDGDEWPWGVGQGALGLEARAGDADILRMCLAVVHPASALACLAERTFMNRLQGGCQVPIGVYSWFSHAGGAGGAGAGAGAGAPSRAYLDACGGASRAYPPAGCASTLTVRGSVCALDGSALYSAQAARAVALPAAAVDAAGWAALQEDAAALGSALARQIVAAGAVDVLGPLTGVPRPLTYGSAELAGGPGDDAGGGAGAEGGAGSTTPA